MSKLDNLIKQFCPNGVEYKKLGEITYWDKRFNGVVKEKQQKILNYKHTSAEILKSIELVRNGNIRLLSTGNYTGYTTEEYVDDKELVNQGEVISLPSGGSASIKYHNGLFIDSGNILCGSADKSKFHLKYIFYYLLNVNDQIEKWYRGGGIKHPSMPEILQIQIPVPPLPVQEEIVRILDGFTELEKELGYELERRKQQYEYYEKQLLTPENMNGNVKLETLEDIAEIKRGIRVVKNDLEPTGEYAVYQNSLKPLGYYDKYNYEGFTTFVITAGAAGDIGFSLSPFWAADDCLGIKTPKSLNNKYVYHFLSTKQDFLYSRVRRGAVPRLSREAVEKLKIPVPSLAEQERIVGILDKFDALISNISTEIDGRKKQYEYYRSKLLTFPQAV